MERKLHMENFSHHDRTLSEAGKLHSLTARAELEVELSTHTVPTPTVLSSTAQCANSSRYV